MENKDKGNEEGGTNHRRASISNDAMTNSTGSAKSKRLALSPDGNWNEYLLLGMTHILTLGAGGDVAAKIVDDVQDCLRLDAWKRIEVCSGAYEAFLELKKLMEVNKADEGFTMHAFQKLIHATIQSPEEGAIIVDVVLCAMKLHPTNETIQAMGVIGFLDAGIQVSHSYKKQGPIIAAVLVRIVENNQSSNAGFLALWLLSQFILCKSCGANCLKVQTLEIIEEMNAIPLFLSLLQQENETKQSKTIIILPLLLQQDPSVLKQAVAATPNFERLLEVIQENHGTHPFLRRLREIVGIA